MTGTAALLMSLLMLAAFALAAGGVWLIAMGRDRGKGALMLLAALVMLGNVLIWTL
ncbi:MAG: hypothetical protein ACT4N8_13245 [Sphingosinicella sp.]|uniref:hypothetical protein n=1 Tax=Sphingosinicella sp. TaxID=1917971 RepID=UPI004037F233